MDSDKRMDRLEEDLATIVKLVKMSMQIARQRRSEEKANRPKRSQ
jgi:hypothetical protein